MAEPGKQSFVELMAEPAKQSFVELMEKQPLYGPLMDKPVQYKLRAVHNGTYWSLVIKGDQPDQDLPYVTIELISDDGINVVRAVRKVDYEEDELLRLLKAKDVGTYGPDNKLRDLCKIADDTFQGIVKWHEFCPQLVNSLGFHVDFDIASYPGSRGEEEERAWYTPFAHACNLSRLSGIPHFYRLCPYTKRHRCTLHPSSTYKALVYA